MNAKLPVIYRTMMLLVLLGLAACSTPGKTRSEKINHIETMRQDVLTELYKAHPESKFEIEAAPGYAAFSNMNINFGVASIGKGYGVVVGNSTNKKTYMKMGEVGVGLGLGIKDFRAVFIFQDSAVMHRFVNTGWTFSGELDAAAKTADTGGAVGAELVLDRIKVYQLTEKGLALQLMITGTKYWQDRTLNFIQQPRDPKIF